MISAMRSYQNFIFGLFLFCASYITINYRILVESILYRLAANDYMNSIQSVASFSIQAIVLVLGTVFLPRWPFFILLVLVSSSAMVNITYSQILGGTVNLPVMGWIIVEMHQAGNAAEEFSSPLAAAAIKMVLALLLLFGARKLMRPVALDVSNSGKPIGNRFFLLLIAAIVFPSFGLNFVGIGPVAAERNVYSYSAQLLLAEPPPARSVVFPNPSNDEQIEKIIWLVDESVSHSAFFKVVKSDLEKLQPIDFGEAASMGFCSAPANVTLRSGVNVHQVDETTDLRLNPSIWGYARKAGYRTMLIDGQTSTSGPPQNLLFPPERALIDEYYNASSGLKTDLKIAQKINSHINKKGKEFIYVNFRGVHFQYSDHYPKGEVPETSPVEIKYEKALEFSKQDVFATLLEDVDRDKVAVVYTSDHGQNLEDGVVPHCSQNPVRAEFSVPLLAFLPERLTEQYQDISQNDRSVSQIFPTTLTWMGYTLVHAIKEYDHDLSRPTAQYVWFGRNVVPINRDDKIDVHRESSFPGS